MYVVGQTGTGKTTLLKTMILDDLEAGKGLCVVDPHGDLFKEILGAIPEHRMQDVVVLDPTDREHPVGLNLLEAATEEERYFVVQEFAAIVMRLLVDEFGWEARTMVGPAFFQHMRMNMLLAMSNSDDPGTLVEFCAIFELPNYWRRWMPLRTSDPQLERWVANVLPNQNYLASPPGEMGMGSYVVSRFHSYVFDPMLRSIFGQKRTTIDFREAMDSGKVVVVNLAKGELSEQNSRFLGMVLMAKIQAAAVSRVHLPAAQRRDFFLYVDEFQSIATESFVTMLSEARKFGLGLVLANQFVHQLRDPRIIDAIFGNVGTLVCFRLGQQDAEIMEREMYPVFTRSDLINLPNWQAYVSTLVNGQSAPPFTVETMLPRTAPDEKRARRVRELCRRRYGRPRREVEREIARSLQGSSPTHEE